VAKDGSKFTQSSVKNLNLPDNVNIGGLVRNGEGVIVNGNTTIQADDHVIIFCMISAMPSLETFF
jgi:trk system potassium uptake protein TrkA